jgi:23S rRNA (guanosine2251-2'-O)-methyltransferase
MTDRNSPPLTGVLAKAASGAVEHVKIAKIGNLSRALQALKNMGFLIVGLDGDAETPLSEVDTARPIALVMGAEGAGLRRLTRETCDLLAKLPASGPMRSLNVSNAAAVALYELARPR